MTCRRTDERRTVPQAPRRSLAQPGRVERRRGRGPRSARTSSRRAASTSPAVRDAGGISACGTSGRPGAARPVRRARCAGLQCDHQLVVRGVAHELAQLRARWTRRPGRRRRGPRCCRCSTSRGRGRPAPHPRRSYSPIVTTSTSVPSGRVDLVVGAPDRQLPAHVGLGLDEVPPVSQREAVERAAGAAREPGPVEEHAGTVDDPGLACTLLVLLRPTFLRPSCCCQTSGSSCVDERLGRASRRPCRRSARRACSSRRVRLLGVDALAAGPKMQVQYDVSQVRSQRNTWSASAGSGNSTHARGKSRSTSGTPSAYAVDHGRRHDAGCTAEVPNSSQTRCASACSTSARTPCTCSSSTRTAGRGRGPRTRTRPSCAWPSSSTDGGLTSTRPAHR